jgi:fibronectin-binding autotransporter adhesin
MNGTGTLTLSGVNTYGGGTTVNSGTLTFANALAMPPGGNVTTSATGVVVFSSGYTGAITSSSPAAAAVGSPNLVPEPGTIALLAAAALVGVGALLQRKVAGRC